MRRPVPWLVLAGLLSALVAPVARAANRPDVGLPNGGLSRVVHESTEGISVARLPSGLTLVHKRMPARDLVAVSAWVHVGSRHEDPVQAGISHDLEHLLSRGTKKRRELEDRLEIFSMGGLHGADTFYDRTTYHAVVPQAGFPGALDALADSLRNPLFPEEGIAKERKVVGEEIARMVDRPETASWRASWALAFGRHPYGRPVIGELANLEGLDREDFVAHHRRWYRPANMVVAVAGPLSFAEVMAELARQFPPEEIDGPALPAEAAPSWSFRGFQRLRQVQDVPEPSLDAVVVVPGVRHPDRWALELLAALMGGDGGATLWQELVVGDGKPATSAWSGLQLLEQHGVLWCSVRPRASAEAPRAEAALWTAMARYRDTLPDPKALAGWKESLRRARSMERETPLGLARWLGEATVLGSLDSGLEDLRRLDAVTPEDIRRVARRYLRRDNLTLVLTVPAARVGDAGEDPEATAAAARQLALLEPSEDAEGAATIWAEAAPWTAARERKAGVTSASVVAAPEVRRHVLANGLVVLHERRPGVEMAGLSLQMQGGAADDAPDEAGASALLAEVLQEGTVRLDQAALAAAWRRLGNAWSIGADRESVAVGASVLGEDLPEALSLALEVLTTPRLEPAGLARAKDRLRDRMDREREDPAIRAGRALLEVVWGNGPYGMPVSGTPEALAAATPERLRALLAQRAIPAGCVLSIVDGRSWAELEPLLAKHAAWTPARDGVPAADAAPVPPRVPVAPLAPALVKRRTLHVPLDRQQVHVAVGFPLPAAGHPDALALRVLVGGLAFDGFVDLVYRKPLAYSTGGGATLLGRAGLAQLTLATRADGVDEAVRELVTRWQRAAREGLSPESFRRARVRLEGGLALRDQQAGQAAAARATWYRQGLGEDELAATRAELARVDEATVRRVARTWLVPGRMVVAVAGPVAPRGSKGPEAAHP